MLASARASPAVDASEVSAAAAATGAAAAITRRWQARSTEREKERHSAATGAEEKEWESGAEEKEWESGAVDRLGCLPDSFPFAVRVSGAIYGTAMRANMRTHGKRRQRRRSENGANLF